MKVERSTVTEALEELSQMVFNTKLITLALVVVMAIILTAGALVQDYFVGDLVVSRAVQSVTLSPWDEIMEYATFMGKSFILIAIALATASWAMWRKQRTEALFVMGALASTAVNPVLKVLVNRPRPTDDLVWVWRDFGGLGFPSGHAFSAIVLFGMLFYLAPYLINWKSGVVLIRVLTLALIFLIGVSRVYLGAHWASDVLGGYAYGFMTLTLLIQGLSWVLPRKAVTPPCQESELEDRALRKVEV